MAFWGVEVKSGQPITHSFDRVRGRLRISQATLGIGSSTKTSLVQCNIGDKSPVLLCALLPGKTESCHLDLEFEEEDDVIFSVIGPRSVYLTGYYLGNSRHSNLNDDSDSYGEDIANSETDESTRYSDEDEYEDSFIDDGDFDVSPSSPVSDGRVTDEELLDNKKPKAREGVRKRLKKKYQSVESDDDNVSQQQNIFNDHNGVSGLESEDEDKVLISSLKSKTTEAEANFDRKPVIKGNKETGYGGSRFTELKSKADAIAVDGEPRREKDLPCDSPMPAAMRAENGLKLKKERKKRSSEGKTPRDDSTDCCNALKDDKLQYTEKNDVTNQDLLDEDGQDQKLAIDQKSTKKRKEKATDNKAVQAKEEDQRTNTDRETAIPEAGTENGAKPKKRRKDCPAEGKSVEGSTYYDNVLKDDKGKHNRGGAGNGGRDIIITSEDLKFSSDRSIDSGRVADGDQYEDKKTKRKKNKSKLQENEGNVDVGLPLLMKEKNRCFKEKDEEAKSSQARTLSNGLVIEELEMGKPDGKVAVSGKKVKVQYVGKLKDKGTIFDSNIGKAPFKFRLGAEDVIEGWNIGLDGMQVGSKRRLTIPPSMGYGTQGAGENIPPNSWLVYELELVSVH